MKCEEVKDSFLLHKQNKLFSKDKFDPEAFKKSDINRMNFMQKEEHKRRLVKRIFKMMAL